MHVCNLSEVSQGSLTHGCFSPVKTAALKRKAGAQRASDPVTKATAVKPNVDRTKLLLQKERRRDGVQLKYRYMGQQKSILLIFASLNPDDATATHGLEPRDFLGGRSDILSLPPFNHSDTSAGV